VVDPFVKHPFKPYTQGGIPSRAPVRTIFSFGQKHHRIALRWPRLKEKRIRVARNSVIFDEYDIVGEWA